MSHDRPDGGQRGWQPPEDDQSAASSQPGGYDQSSAFDMPGPAPAYPSSEPAGYGPPPQGRGERPRPLDLAVKLMYVGAGVEVLSGVSALFMGDQMRSQMQDQLAGQPGVSPTLTDTMVSVGIAVAVVAALLSAGLWVLNAVFNGRGAKWARILSTVLAGLAVLSFLLSLMQAGNLLALLLGLATTGLGVVAVVLIWRPDSSRFYDAVSAAKRRR